MKKKPKGKTSGTLHIDVYWEGEHLRSYTEKIHSKNVDEEVMEMTGDVYEKTAVKLEKIFGVKPPQ